MLLTYGLAFAPTALSPFTIQYRLSKLFVLLFIFQHHVYFARGSLGAIIRINLIL